LDKHWRESRQKERLRDRKKTRSLTLRTNILKRQTDNSCIVSNLAKEARSSTVSTSSTCFDGGSEGDKYSYDTSTTVGRIHIKV